MTFSITDEELIVDGIRIQLSLIPEIVRSFFHPDPHKWYRLERIGDNIVIHVKREEEPNG